jgi:hypothetical protein
MHGPVTYPHPGVVVRPASIAKTIRNFVIEEAYIQFMCLESSLLDGIEGHQYDMAAFKIWQI